MQGMYPTVIIVLVALKNSHLEHQFTSYGTHHSVPDTPYSGRTLSARLGKSADEGIMVSSEVMVLSDISPARTRDDQKKLQY
jgi:hypothetical protein